MDSDASSWTLTDPADRGRLMRAIEEYGGKGRCSVRCDRCGELIEFRQIGEEVWEHWCRCGKYKGTLRGL